MVPKGDGSFGFGLEFAWDGGGGGGGEGGVPGNDYKPDISVTASDTGGTGGTTYDGTFRDKTDGFAYDRFVDKNGNVIEFRTQLYEEVIVIAPSGPAGQTPVRNDVRPETRPPLSTLERSIYALNEDRLTPTRDRQSSNVSHGEISLTPVPSNVSAPSGSRTKPYNPNADSPFVSWLLYGKDTPFRDFLTNDANLQVVQNIAYGVAVGASAIATGGLILDAAPGIFGTGIGTLGIGTASTGTIGTVTAAAPAALVIATNPGVQEELQELETLAPQLENTLAAELPTLSYSGQRLAQNFARGNAFQNAVTKAFGLERNTKTIFGQTNSRGWRATIVDVYAGGVTPIADIKDVLRLYYTLQLQTQNSIANFTTSNIILSPRTLSVSNPLANAVQASGGFVFRVDPYKLNVDVWDAASRVWVPFLGGNWGL